MYKATGKAHFRITRTADSSLTPRLAPQKEEVKSTGGGAAQVALSDGNYSAELQRQGLLKEKEVLDQKLAKLRTAISTAKYTYRKSAVGLDPRMLHKWENEAADMGRRSQELQREAAALNRLRKIENTLSFENEFISAAREILHPDVFERIERIAQDRAVRTSAMREADFVTFSKKPIQL